MMSLRILKIVIGLVAGLSLNLTVGSVTLAQKAPDFANMEARIGQLVQILHEGKSCSAIEAALDLAPGLLYGGTRPLLTKVPDTLDEARERFGETIEQRDLDIAKRAARVDEIINANEKAVIAPLHDLALGARCPELGGQAADLKFFVKEMADVAAAIGEYTAQCAQGDSLREGQCAQLRPFLNEENGHFFGPNDDGVPVTIKRGFAVKLRSPFTPRTIRRWEEDVKRIPALAPDECAAVFKETKGLMLRLRYDGFTVIRDPWATPQLPRGTRIPIWTLEWVPSEYVKHFNLCNRDGRIRGSVTQRVKQDIPLNYFWRYYSKTRH